MSAIEVSSRPSSLRVSLTSWVVMVGQLSRRRESFLWASSVAEWREETREEA